LGTGQLYVTVSDEDGRYAVPIAAAGKYAVRAELAGFAADIQGVEILEGANTTRLDLTLHIASAATAPPGAGAVSHTGTSNEPPSSQDRPASTDISGQPVRQSSPALAAGTPTEMVFLSGAPVQSESRTEPGRLSLGSKRRRLLHGSFLYEGASSALDAKPYALRGAETAKPDYASHRYSFSLGGPIAFSRASAQNARTSFSISYSGSRTGSAFGE